MDEHKKILLELVENIVKIRNKLNEIIKHKLGEIKKLTELDDKYSTIEEILKLDIPVNNDIASFLASVGDTISFVEGKITKYESPSSIDDMPFYSAMVSGTTIMMSLSSVPNFDTIIPNDTKKKIYRHISEEHKEKKIRVTQFLEKISPHLVPIYYSAYDNLEVVSSDPERGAMALMREIIDHVLGILAPNDDVKIKNWFVSEPTSKTGITRKHRVRYIAENKTKNAEYKELIIENAEIFEEVINALNKFHKRGVLNKDEAKAFFYQAEELLEILCDCVDPSAS
ncbi:MAG: hypothetical protein PHU91_01290 [Candidatus Omnitrophica bacterium]|nr:hypothetical protein [Candidatus Omnitrophota bacterium]MDD5236295.1 hypothetical protein [Candidatus Omnitrophota bacterium]MDD5611347.1 hypothetical protein [Candidatus Omnitrophota bacterium]